MAAPGSATLADTRGLRPFKSHEEYLYAMKEDLAEWLNNLYAELHMNVANFMDRLDTGVALCRHSNNVRRYAEEHMAKRASQGKEAHSIAHSVLQHPQVKHLPGARPGTFFARDNVSNFIGWARRGLGVIECLLFETDDLIMRKNEKHVILCLLEVARRGAKLGMPAPMLIQLEREIDREILADKRKLGFQDNEYYDADMEDDLSDSDDDVQCGPLPQIVTNDLKSLDEMVRDLVARCTCPTQFPMIRVSEGKYRIGDTKVLIFVRVLRSHVMVRVGGGWDTLSHYLDKHDPCRCKTSHKTAVSSKLTGVRTGGPAIDINHSQVHYERSPPRTRRSSVSSTGSGVNPSLLTPSSSLLTPSPSHTSRARSTTPDPNRARSISTGRDRRSVSRHRDGENDRRSVSRQRDSDKIYRDTESSRQRRSVSRQRDTESTRASKPRTSDNGRSHSIASNDGGHTRNDNGNSRSGSLDYAASSRGNSIDYPSFSRNSSLDYGNNRYLNHNEGESYSLPYDINISGGKSRSDSCYSDHLDVSKINEEINKLNRTCNELDENAFLKRSNPCEYEAGIDSSPAPRVSDNFNRTYEQVNITRPVTPIQTKSRVDSGVDTTPSCRISDNFVSSKASDAVPSLRISDNFVSSTSNDSSDEGYRSLGPHHTKPASTNAPTRSVSSLSSKPSRSRSTGNSPPSPSVPRASPFRRNVSAQRSARGRTPVTLAAPAQDKNNTWSSRGGAKQRPTLNDNTFVEQVADIIQQYAALVPSPRKDKLGSNTGSSITSTRIPAPIHQRT